MAATSYTYSISTDFPNQRVNTTELLKEVRGSSIVVAIDHINTSTDNCILYFKDELTVGDKSALDSLISGHSGNPSQENEPKYSSVGGMLVANTYPIYEDDGGFEGALIDAPAGQTSFHDLKITTEVHVTGGFFWSNNVNLGDYVDVSVVDKDDVLGLFAQYGLVPGDVLELGKWLRNVFLKPGETQWTAFISDDVAPVTAGLYLRCKYENTGSSKADMGIVYRVFYGK